MSELDALVVPSSAASSPASWSSRRGCGGFRSSDPTSGGSPSWWPTRCRPLLFAPGDGADLVRALRLVAVEPGRYTGSPESAESTWPEHLDAVGDAYVCVVVGEVRSSGG